MKDYQINKCEYDNHTGISLMCVAGKIIRRIILNSTFLWLNKSCFDLAVATVELIFSVRQPRKTHTNMTDFFVTFVDLTKDFHTVSRDVFGSFGRS